MIYLRISSGVHIIKLLYYRHHRPTGYERVHLPLCEVADTPFHVQGGRYECSVAKCVWGVTDTMCPESYMQPLCLAH